MDIAAIIAKLEDHDKKLEDHEKRICTVETASAAMNDILILKEDIQDLVGLLKQGRALFAFASLIGRGLAWVARSVREIAVTIAVLVALYYLIYKSDISTFSTLLGAFGR